MNEATRTAFDGTTPHRGIQSLADRRSTPAGCATVESGRTSRGSDRSKVRTLLAGPPDLPAVAVPLALDSPLAGTIAPLAATYYQISSDMAGKLTVMLQAPGFPARVSLVDATGSAARPERRLRDRRR